MNIAKFLKVGYVKSDTTDPTLSESWMTFLGSREFGLNVNGAGGTWLSVYAFSATSEHHGSATGVDCAIITQEEVQRVMDRAVKDAPYSIVYVQIVEDERQANWFNVKVSNVVINPKEFEVLTSLWVEIEVDNDGRRQIAITKNRELKG